MKKPHRLGIFGDVCDAFFAVGLIVQTLLLARSPRVSKEFVGIKQSFEHSRKFENRGADDQAKQSKTGLTQTAADEYQLRKVRKH